MGTTTITISGTLIGGATGSQNYASTSIVNTGAVEYVQQVPIASATFTALTVPVGAKGVYIIPPPGNTSALTIKGVTGDTGLPINPSGPFATGFPSSPSNFGITSGAAVTGNVAVIWI